MSGALRIRRLVRTLAAMPLPAYNAGSVVCHQLGLPEQMADRMRELVKWERYKMFVR